MATRLANQPGQPLDTFESGCSIEVVHDEWRLCGDTPGDILGLLIDGYGNEADEEGRRRARLHLAVRARTVVQAMLNSGRLFGEASPEEAEILVDYSDSPPTPNEWTCATPLTLIAVFYQPIGPLAQPHTDDARQIWWIDPSTPQSLLTTLHQVRWLDLSVSNGSSVWQAASTDYQNLGTNGGGGYWWRSLSV